MSAAKQVMAAPAQEGGSASFEHMQRLATSIAKSGLFGIKDVDQALALMAIAAAEGKNPALIARDFDIIQGRPAKKSEAMLRDFLGAGGKVEWHTLTNELADATFTHPQGGSMRIGWDMVRAKAAGLIKAEGMYTKYPRAMLRARCVSEGVRTIWPGATSGMYTPEEALDIPEVKDITPPATQQAAVEQVTSSTALTKEEIEAHINAMDVSTLPMLQTAFEAAWKHASDARDRPARERFQNVYNQMKAQIAAAKQPQDDAW